MLQKLTALINIMDSISYLSINYQVKQMEGWTIYLLAYLACLGTAVQPPPGKYHRIMGLSYGSWTTNKILDKNVVSMLYFFRLGLNKKRAKGPCRDRKGYIKLHMYLQ